MTTEQDRPKQAFWKPFIALFLLGMLGVVSLLLIIDAQLEAIMGATPELAELPTTMLYLTVLLQPTILLAIATAVGCLLAFRVDLRSFVYEKMASGEPVWPRLSPQIPLAFIAGLLLAVVITLLDLAFSPFTREALETAVSAQANPIPQVIMGMLYGGITEELLLRWGFMTLLAWLGWRFLSRSKGLPGSGLMWGAIILAAGLFGIGHLPALSAIVPLTTALVIRTVFLNMVGGILFGWLFWRRSLEAAMIAHASTHVGFFLIHLVVGLFS
jgi:hypothetical protein